MQIKRTGMRVADEGDVGVYLWKLPSGNYLADTDRNMLQMPAMRGDISAMAKMAAAAAHYGYPDGTAEFIGGAYPCSDEEYDEQIAELKAGNRPDVTISRR